MFCGEPRSEVQIEIVSRGSEKIAPKDGSEKKNGQRLNSISHLSPLKKVVLSIG
jgi:hypothetical protein